MKNKNNEVKESAEVEKLKKEYALCVEKFGKNHSKTLYIQNRLVFERNFSDAKKNVTRGDMAEYLDMFPKSFTELLETKNIEKMEAEYRKRLSILVGKLFEPDFSEDEIVASTTLFVYLADSGFGSENNFLDEKKDYFINQMLSQSTGEFFANTGFDSEYGKYLFFCNLLNAGFDWTGKIEYSKVSQYDAKYYAEIVSIEGNKIIPYNLYAYNYKNFTKKIKLDENQISGCEFWDFSNSIEKVKPKVLSAISAFWNINKTLLQNNLQDFNYLQTYQSINTLIGSNVIRELKNFKSPILLVENSIFINARKLLEYILIKNDIKFAIFQDLLNEDDFYLKIEYNEDKTVKYSPCNICDNAYQVKHIREYISSNAFEEEPQETDIPNQSITDNIVKKMGEEFIPKSTINVMLEVAERKSKNDMPIQSIALEENTDANMAEFNNTTKVDFDKAIQEKKKIEEEFGVSSNEKTLESSFQSSEQTAKTMSNDDEMSSFFENSETDNTQKNTGTFSDLIDNATNSNFDASVKNDSLDLSQESNQEEENKDSSITEDLNLNFDDIGEFNNNDFDSQMSTLLSNNSAKDAQKPQTAEEKNVANSVSNNEPDLVSNNLCDNEKSDSNNQNNGTIDTKIQGPQQAERFITNNYTQQNTQFTPNYNGQQNGPYMPNYNGQQNSQFMPNYNEQQNPQFAPNYNWQQNGQFIPNCYGQNQNNNAFDNKIQSPQQNGQSMPNNYMQQNPQFAPNYNGQQNGPYMPNYNGQQNSQFIPNYNEQQNPQFAPNYNWQQSGQFIPNCYGQNQNNNAFGINTQMPQQNGQFIPNNYAPQNSQFIPNNTQQNALFAPNSNELQDAPLMLDNKPQDAPLMLDNKPQDAPLMLDNKPQDEPFMLDNETQDEPFMLDNEPQDAPPVATDNNELQNRQFKPTELAKQEIKIPNLKPILQPKLTPPNVVAKNAVPHSFPPAKPPAKPPVIVKQPPQVPKMTAPKLPIKPKN